MNLCRPILCLSCTTLFLIATVAPAVLAADAWPATQPGLRDDNFAATAYGRLPSGWRDLFAIRPTPGWIVDGNNFLRATLKSRTGMIARDGEVADGTITADFKKTEDAAVSFAVAGRIVDRDNFYLARVTGNDRLEILKVKAGQEEPLNFVKPVTDVGTRQTGLITLKRYREGERWRLSLGMQKDVLSARVFDAEGVEMARIDAVDAEFPRGRTGLRATRFAAAASFRVDALGPNGEANVAAAKSKPTTSPAAEEKVIDYAIVKPHWKTDELNTPRDKVGDSYDVVIAGAGTGGWSAALQAARLGTRVLLLEETDWIGGQMCAAAVASMDEDSVHMKFPVRERGVYREFHESMVAYYSTLDKDPFMAYYSYPQQIEGGYEPKAARAVLYALIKHARDKGATLDVSLRTRVAAVKKDGDTVTGATIEFTDDSGATTRKDVASKILIDATEYGDVLPLTGTRYRAGNATSESPNPAAPVQDHTWTCVLREYPNGVPEHLKIKEPPPGYEQFGAKRWRNYRHNGFMIWGAAGKGIKGNRSWRVYFAWRGMADTESPLLGERSVERHTQCGFNGGNDYPVTAATLDDPATRAKDEREGIYRTLQALYYFQNELGVNWSLAEDEGFDTPYNRQKMKRLDLRPDLEKLAVHLPQMPYVRESRRMFGVRTLVANDLQRYENAKLFPTSVAMGDYFMDLDHGGTGTAIETDLDDHNSPKGGGPFQVPFEVFLPEKLDGFVPAEKNFAQSRIANGATRLQPITMLTGQAAGTIAALAVKQQKQPRQLDPRQVQAALLDSGCTLIQRWHADVPWGTPTWRATQLLSLYQVMDRPGPITRDREPLGAANPWGVDQPLSAEELRAALSRLAELRGVSASSPSSPPPASDRITMSMVQDALRAIDANWSRAAADVKVADPNRVTAGDLALIAARILVLHRERRG